MQKLDKCFKEREAFVELKERTKQLFNKLRLEIEK